ncbi:MAG: DNA polymerase III subunit chi [Caulobacterales bacterium]|nr:DNA polymerase III subunit chi [Caulobacterales bacterium]
MKPEARGDVWFYHLERSSLDQVLPGLLEKTLQRGWRALVRVRDPALMGMLDERLWTWRDESFLPHGRADDDHSDRQPVLLTAGVGNPNRADALFLVDGAAPDDAADFERCLIIFDGQDTEALARAREQWKSLKQAGAEASYWRQSEEGTWSRAA